MLWVVARKSALLRRKALFALWGRKGASLASRLGRLSKLRNGKAHPDVGRLDAAHKVLSASSGREVKAEECAGAMAAAKKDTEGNNISQVQIEHLLAADRACGAHSAFGCIRDRALGCMRDYMVL